MSEVSEINSVNVPELLEFKNTCAQNPEQVDCNPELVAYWEGGSRAGRIQRHDHSPQRRWRVQRNGRMDRKIPMVKNRRHSKNDPLLHRQVHHHRNPYLRRLI